MLDLTLTDPLADHPEAIGLDEEICKEAGILMVDGASARQKLFSTDLEEHPVPAVVMHLFMMRRMESLCEVISGSVFRQWAENWSM